MWLKSDEWHFVQKHVPITCVDVLPVKAVVDGDRSRQELGLIYRETPHQGKRWCLIGGRLLRKESFCEAIGRQLNETLGSNIEFAIPQDIQPVYAAQYFPEARAFGLVDPRQHSIGLIFAVPITGVVRPAGEAISFKWFAPSNLPAPDEMWHGQHEVLLKVIARLDVPTEVPV